MSYYRDLLVGKAEIPSRTDFKYAMLRSQFAGIMRGECILCFLDSSNGVTVFIPYYAILGGGGIISFFLNRNRKYLLATITQLGTINVLIFIFADVDNPYGGVYFYFITCSLVALILLNYYHRTLSIAFALLPIVLGYFAYTIDLSLIPEPSYEPQMIRVNFIANPELVSSPTLL